MSFTFLPLWANLVIFAFAAAAVWAAGTRLSRYVDETAERTGIGHAFAGMLLLGGITSLPEVAAASSAAAAGNASLSLNNLFGSCAFNLLLIAMADAVFGRRALTSVLSRPGTLLQGVLGVIGLAVAATAALVGDVRLFTLGAWPLAILLLAVGAFWLSFGYRERAPWVVKGAAAHGDGLPAEAPRSAYSPRSLRALIGALFAVGAIILVAGYALSMSADAIAAQTGVGAGLIGFILVSFATSLPEVSTIVSAVRLRRYEMAVGDVFGTNLFNLGLLFVADAFFVGGPIMSQAGSFEALAALLGIVLTAFYLVGLLERADKAALRMGYDSLAVIATYVGGVALLVFAA